MTGEESPRFEDALFRRKRKHGEWQVVDGPMPPLEAALADAHTHLSPDDAPLVLARAAAHGVDFICEVASATDDMEEVVAGLDAWVREARALLPRIAPDVADVPRIRIAAGCHPHDARKYTPAVEARLREVLHDPRVCAVGEIGLDYFYDNSTPEDQRRVFRAQLRLAHESGLPVQLHIRGAHAEALGILREEGFPAAGVMLHCCSLPADELRPWVEAGCHISYGGAITFARSDEARSAVPLVPEDRIVTETDAPYMTPVPLRGTPCESAHVAFTAARLAEVLGRAPGPARAALLQRFHDNALALLDRPPTAWQRS